MKDDGIPFNNVFDNIFDINNVKNIPNKITPSTTNVDIIDAPIPCMLPAINIVAIVIKNGNLPLHGTKLFVRIAISLSLGELIILHPTTPAALQPNPMHIVIICLPCATTFFKETVHIKSNSR